MTFLSPWWLGAAALLGAGVVILHLLARRRPRSFLFPTARFIPDRPAASTALAARPSDPLVLLVRLLLLLLLAASLARPIISPPRRTTQIVLLNQPGSSQSGDTVISELAASADSVIPFDGSLSAGLVAALRTVPALASQGDSIALTIVAPFDVAHFDHATFPIREQWQGAISLVVLPPAAETRAPAPVVLSPDDPLSATLALIAPPQGFVSRLARGLPTREDSAWVGSGGHLVLWPRNPAELAWTRNSVDTLGGVATGNVAVVAAFPRQFSPPGGTPSAMWTDGEPAATTTRLGNGCITNVAIPVPGSGDLVLRPAFLEFTRSLLASCDGRSRSIPASEALLTRLRGGPSLFPSRGVASPSRRRTPADPWLLTGAMLLFLVEPLVRRQRPG